ncbi:aldo/keto reductase [Fulvivirga kasyanovii]|uniref:Voltage-dependent potassium channel subunit beta n=1 Tax=Fulvivirga kasyanovii TaxID=396812 RepID=A0ABW9RVU0_9BACT|nr:aldo/keto reductase [Fulvivirga kasyanovii]MTI28344.1 voltage-dependent potassium channel subunit beta [Fulvivirga kasyanovii]
MEYKRLGKSGLQVSRLSFGSWLTFGKQIGDNTAEDLMTVAYDNGINFFDNAESYAGGKSEEVMGEVLKKKGWRRDSYIVSSKVFFGADGGMKDLKPTQVGLSRKHVVEACHQALKRLQVDYLDLYFCHRPDKQTPIEETVWAMHNLIQQGKVLYWGTSEWSAQEIMEAHMVARQYNLIGPTMEQPQYNMFVRNKVEVEYSQIYKTVGLGTTIWSPLASGVLTGKYNDGFPEGTRLGIEGLEWLKDRSLAEENLAKVKKLTGLSKELGMSMPLLALAWCLKNDDVSTVILGASKKEQLQENLKALEAKEKLTAEVMEKIESILANKPEHPVY